MWLDNASDVDILFYEPYADVIADLAKNKDYKPLTIGVFGIWGAGKSTLLNLIQQKVQPKDGEDKKTICININAWTFEGYEDAKVALMESLLCELKKRVPEGVQSKLTKLLKKIDYFKLATKAVSVGAPIAASIAMGNPLPLVLGLGGSAENIGQGVKSAADALQSIRDNYLKEGKPNDDENSIVNNVRTFKEEFAKSLDDENIENVIVLIDDLDRCQPDRIIETLEAIKLFLAVNKMCCGILNL
jgi:predicted KAP-like P-loop ATPase